MAKKKKAKRGRPSKLAAVDLGQVETMAGFGLIGEQIALLLGVHERTLRNWAKDPAFAEALERGRLKADVNVARSLYHKAVGFQQLRHHPPDEAHPAPGGWDEVLQIPGETTAMIFWLKNRRVDQWRDVQQVTHGGKVGMDNKLEIVVVETK